jgi:tetrahydromethanopterin S-methyltransferase subunit G
MEILLLVAVIVVAASGLYVAATFNKRSELNAAPLIDRIDQIKTTASDQGQQIQVITGELRGVRELTTQGFGEIQGRLDRTDRRIQAITGELQRVREPATQGFGEIQGRLDQTDRQIADISSQLLAEIGTIRHLSERIGMRQDEFDADLRQLDRRVAQLGESLVQQAARIREIRDHAKSQGMRPWSSSRMDSLALAMLEAESHMDRKGWGQPPRLYALTEKISPTAADHELSADMQDTRPGELVPVEQDPLPEGDLIEALAEIHWPEDVVGCVLVTELTSLPPGRKEDGPSDPVVAEQWTSPRPDGRPARLAVGVCRKGEHKCGLRIKGEDDVQLRVELADNLVTALLGTF